MINFPAVETALNDWWEPLGAQVVFADEPRPYVNDAIDAIILLDIMGARRTGHDELRFSPNPDDPNQLDPEVTGSRVLTVSCQVWVAGQEIGRRARDYCEQARQRLKLPSVVEILRKGGLAVVMTMPFIALPKDPEDQRIRSRGGFDVLFAVAASERPDTGTATVDTIGAVEVQSDKLNDVDGTPVDPQVEKTIE